MGIYDREYYRDEGGNWGGWADRGATPWLIGITCAVWIAQLATRDAAWGGVTALGIYDPIRITQGEVWRLLTPVFLHSETNLLHIIFNMFVLYWVGTQLEERFGSREFLAFYLAAGLFAEAVQFAVHVLGLMPFSRGLGASGAVTASLVVYAFLYPRQRVLVMFVIPMPVWLAVAIFVTLDALGALGAKVNQEPIGYVVHLGGALFGAIYYLSGLRLTSLLPSGASGGSGRARAQPRLRVVPPDEPDEADTDEPATPPPPPDERFEERVDRLLEKVSKYGQESLTAEERELLFRAGEHYKKRRR